MIISKSDIGNMGEKIAAQYLKKIGFNILERNIRTPYGEIDIIVSRAGILGFVEVRTRSKNNVNPLDSIGTVKQKRILRSAFHYLRKNNKRPEKVQFHAIGINLNNHGDYKLEFIEDAFSLL